MEGTIRLLFTMSTIIVQQLILSLNYKCVDSVNRLSKMPAIAVVVTVGDPRMSRKDYIRIAAALRAVRPEHSVAHAQWLRDVNVIANALTDDNPRFDRARFESAAGVYL